MGISASIWGGAVCFAEAFQRPPHYNAFGGFWDKDHHVWAVTQFTEVVDFTISQMNLHPANSRPDTIPVPAVWWDDVTLWPPTIRYLPEGRLKLELPRDEAEDLETFRHRVDRVFDDVLAQLDREDVPETPLLSGPESMNRLYKIGEPWVVGTLRYQEERGAMTKSCG